MVAAPVKIFLTLSAEMHGNDETLVRPTHRVDRSARVRTRVSQYRSARVADCPRRRVRRVLLHGDAERHHFKRRVRARFRQNARRVENCPHDCLRASGRRVSAVQVKQQQTRRRNQ